MKTKGDVFIRLASQETGKPEWRIRAKLDAIASSRKPPSYFFDELTDAEFEALVKDPDVKERMTKDVFALLEIFHDA